VAVPKNKKSKAKRDTRKNSFKLEAVNVVECPRCHSKKLAHRVCISCGYYDNKEIIKIEAKGKEKSKEKEKEKGKEKKVKSNSGSTKKIKAQPVTN
jgi:large subunit ribosomal protein L32